MSEPPPPYTPRAPSPTANPTTNSTSVTTSGQQSTATQRPAPPPPSSRAAPTSSTQPKPEMSQVNDHFCRKLWTFIIGAGSLALLIATAVILHKQTVALSQLSHAAVPTPTTTSAATSTQTEVDWQYWATWTAWKTDTMTIIVKSTATITLKETVTALRYVMSDHTYMPISEVSAMTATPSQSATSTTGHTFPA